MCNLRVLVHFGLGSWLLKIITPKYKKIEGITGVCKVTLYACIILSVCLAVCHTCGVDCVHMVRPTIMVSSPYGSSVVLVHRDIRFIPKFEEITPSEGAE